MFSNFNKFKLILGLLLLLAFPVKVFAGDETQPENLNEENVSIDEEIETFQSISTQEIRINEIYPNPNTGEKEFVEIYVEDPSNFDIAQYQVKDESTIKKSLSSAIWEDNLLLLEISGSYLNNDKDKAYLLEKVNGEIIDSICYGQITDTTDCNWIIESPPPKGKTLAYIDDLNEFVVTSPTPNKPNIFINLNFYLKNENSEVKNSFEKGEIISILDESEYYGIENPIFQWYLDELVFEDVEIETKEMLIGQHILKLAVGDKTETQAFTVTETAADFSGLEISEVFPNPKGDDSIENGEWIEIYNSSNRTINLVGLVIERFTNTQNYKYKIEEDQNILPNEYLVFYPNFSLTNENGNLRLVDPQGKIINSLSYSERIEEDESVIFIDDEVKITTTPTKLLPNKFTPRKDDEIPNQVKDDSVEIITDFSTIEITEIFPNPEGNDIAGKNEWIELYNFGNEKVNLKGLVILQITGRNSRFTIENDFFIDKNSFLLVYPAFSINNTEARIQLLNEEDKVFDDIFYQGSVKENESLIRQDDSSEFITTITPTPGSANIESGLVLSAGDVESVPIDNAKSGDEGTIVVVKGAITVEPNVLGSDIFYIQDETGGIQIDLDGTSKDFLQKDVVIEIEGKLGTYHGEKRIIVNENTITSINQAENIQPKLMDISKIEEKYIGSLIKIVGTVVKTSGNTFYVNDGSGTIKVQIKTTTEIERPECRKGYYAEIIGILSVWDKDENGKPVYRLLPRYQEDVFISKKLANTGGKNWIGIMIGFSIVTQMIAICNQKIRHRKQSALSLSK